MEKKNEKSVFATLNAINVNEHVEKKKTGEKNPDGTEKTLSYLSWVWAWGQVKQLYPDASYEVKHWDGKPYLCDELIGFMVETSVTIQGETMTMWLPVMDNKNKAMKAAPYTYKTKYGEKEVAPATMFDISASTSMRVRICPKRTPSKPRRLQPQLLPLTFPRPLRRPRPARTATKSAPSGRSGHPSIPSSPNRDTNFTTPSWQSDNQSNKLN